MSLLWRRSLYATAAAILLAALGFAQTPTTTPVKTGYAPVNGLKLYYEIHGTGEPLILLHGGVEHLAMRRADVMGYSLGGGVALRTAIQHPDAVRKLVLVSTAFKKDGWYPAIRAGMAQMGPGAAEPMKQTPMYQLYARVAPRPADWPVLLTKLGEMMKKDYDWSREVAAIKAPTLLVFGDADAVSPAHAVQFFELLGGGQKDGGWDGSGVSKARLAILPGLTHYNVFSSPALPSTVTPFLDAPMPAAN